MKEEGERDKPQEDMFFYQRYKKDYIILILIISNQSNENHLYKNINYIIKLKS